MYDNKTPSSNIFKVDSQAKFSKCPCLTARKQLKGKLVIGSIRCRRLKSNCQLNFEIPEEPSIVMPIPTANKTGQDEVIICNNKLKLAQAENI